MSSTRSTGSIGSISVALEPVYNALNSFSLLTASERLSGLNIWVNQTASSLSPERRHTNRLVFEGLRDALTPEDGIVDFATYLQRLAEQNPSIIRDRLLECLIARFSSRFSTEDAPVAPNAERLLEDRHAFLTCVEYVQVDAPFDAGLQAEVYALLNNPPAMQQMLVAHLEDLWKTTFAAEWKRVQPSLNWQVKMFAQSLDEEASLAETYRMFTGKELAPDLPTRLADTAEIVLVPSWHTGRHTTLWESDAKAFLFFSEPPNYDISLLRSAPVGRGELRARLDALADETRLRILELLVRTDEMHAQDIIAVLELSQSSVSRHLKQLVSLGYLYERRGEGANKTYRLSSYYFARTARAIEQLVSGEYTESVSSVETTDETLSHELRRFLDRSGKLTMWPPARQRDKLLILEYLASYFEQGRVYTEKEVNELLLLHSVVKDSAALRRAMYEYRFMNRTRDGSRYWLIGSEIEEANERHPFSL